MYPARLLTGLALVATVAAGCGTTHSASAAPAAAPAPTVMDGGDGPALVHHNASEVRRALHLGASGVVTLRGGVECEVAEVMTSATEVSMYTDAGDNVAANLARTVGVKIIADEAQTCNVALTKRLESVAP
jgi:hypothetical protein